MNNIFIDFLYNSTRILKHLPDAVLLINSKGKIIWTNDRASVIFECNKKILRSYSLNDLIDNGKEKIEKSILTNEPVIAGATLPNSKSFFIELNAKKYHRNYIVTIRDITAIANVVSNAEQTNQFNNEKNAMLVKLENELKSPIDSIIGFSQALLDGVAYRNTQKRDKYLKIINKSSNELLELMEHFINFSYAESTLYEHDYQTFDVINTIQTIVKNMKNKISDKIEVKFDFEDFDMSKRIIYSDEKTLKTILQNLLKTSLNLTDSGNITFKVTIPELDYLQNIKDFADAKEDSYIQLSIIDTGIGLQENELPDLFEPYKHLEKQTKRNMTRAFCLGTANILVKRLNGKIGIKSEVMKGTTFNVIIPIKKDINE